MSYKLINETYCPYVNECRKEFICDTDADFGKLPECCVGSTAVSIESGKVYVVSTFGNWIPFGEGYVEKDPNAVLPAGLYDENGVKVKSWQDLIDEGILKVEDGVLTCTYEGDSDPLVSTFRDNLIIIDDGSVTSLGTDAFYSCYALKRVVIPNSVTNIGDWAFSGCHVLTTVNIPNGVTNIGKYAFEGCALTSITFNGTVAQWNAIIFGKDWNANIPATEVICTDGTVTL